jgi:predicted transcriptional regulator
MIVIHPEMQYVKKTLRRRDSKKGTVLAAISGDKCTLYKIHAATGINELVIRKVLASLIAEGKVIKRDSGRKATQFVTYFYSRV